MSFVTADRVCVLQDSDGNQRQWCNPCRFDVQAKVAWDLVAPVKAADSGDDDVDDDPTADERTVDEFIRLEDGTVYKTFYDYNTGGYYIDGEPIEYCTSAPWVDPSAQSNETRSSRVTNKPGSPAAKLQAHAAHFRLRYAELEANTAQRSEEKLSEEHYYLCMDLHYSILNAIEKKGPHRHSADAFDVIGAVADIWSTVLPAENLETEGLKNSLITAAIWAGFDAAIKMIAGPLQIGEWDEWRDVLR